MKYWFITAFYLLVFAAHAQVKDRFSEKDTTTTTDFDPEFTTQRAPAKAAPANNRFVDRLRFGGMLGGGFSNIYTFVNVSPRVFYLVTPKLWTGVGGTFIYMRDNRFPPPYNEHTVYGFNVFSMYQLVQTNVGNLFAQVEYEPLNFQRIRQDVNGIFTERAWAQGLFLGGGIMQTAGRGGIFISVLYNITWFDGDRSYYTSPWVFRIGVGF